jgi:hypothetical protein
MDPTDPDPQHWIEGETENVHVDCVEAQFKYIYFVISVLLWRQ